MAGRYLLVLLSNGHQSQLGIRIHRIGEQAPVVDFSDHRLALSADCELTSFVA